MALKAVVVVVLLALAGLLYELTFTTNTTALEALRDVALLGTGALVNQISHERSKS